MKHLIFYDGECGLCDHAVQFVLSQDKKAFFAFAPLQGKTAAEKLKSLPSEQKNVDSLILIENFNQPNEKISLLGYAAFRILWLLGGAWTLLGWISFLPPFLYNWGYRLVAKYRHKLFPKDVCKLPDRTAQNRFME